MLLVMKCSVDVCVGNHVSFLCCVYIC